AALLGGVAHPAAGVAAGALCATEHQEWVVARIDEAHVDHLAIVVDGVLAHALVARPRGGERRGAARGARRLEVEPLLDDLRCAGRVLGVTPALYRCERGRVEGAFWL